MGKPMQLTRAKMIVTTFVALRGAIQYIFINPESPRTCPKSCLELLDMSELVVSRYCTYPRTCPSFAPKFTHMFIELHPCCRCGCTTRARGWTSSRRSSSPMSSLSHHLVAHCSLKEIIVVPCVGLSYFTSISRCRSTCLPALHPPCRSCASKGVSATDGGLPGHYVTIYFEAICCQPLMHSPENRRKSCTVRLSALRDEHSMYNQKARSQVETL